MAKALIAAVSLALVLVAAVVVPMALTPGVYGFDDWPEAKAHAPVEQVVSVDLPRERTLRAERDPRQIKPKALAPPRQLVVAAPPVAAPAPAVVPRAQQATPQQPIAPQTQQQPQAAHEAPVPAPVVDARDHTVPVPHAVAGEVESGLRIDGTNQR